MTPAAASELHKNCVMLVVDDRIGASAGCAEVDGEVREWLREAAEAEVSAAALRVLWAMCLAYDAACLPFGMVGELRRKLGPIALAVLLLFMGVGIMNIRVSAEFPSSRQRAAFGPRDYIIANRPCHALHACETRIVVNCHGSELRFAPIYNLCSWPAHTKTNYIFPDRNLGRKKLPYGLPRYTLFQILARPLRY